MADFGDAVIIAARRTTIGKVQGSLGNLDAVQLARLLSGTL
jgi:acetyl-CoA acetyltransferase